MELIVCTQCQKNMSALTCGYCTESVCKTCAEFLEPESFLLLKDPPKEILHGTFCGACYVDKVEGPLAAYNETLAVAENIAVYYKDEGKETRLVRRIEKPISIPVCDDKDEVVMRLAFQAAQGGFNAVVDINLIPEKVLMGRYQKLRWRGTGVPVQLAGRSRVIEDRTETTWRPN